MVALTVVAIVLYSQERSLSDLAQQVANLRSEQERMAGQLTSRTGFTPADVDVTGAPALGPADDVVTLIEFSDYECPFCIKYFTQTLPLIQANYVATGKIRYVFKDFPVDANHPMAIRAHEAAHCAMEQQKFWALHVKLFSAPGTHTPDQLVARATEAGLDVTAFKACIASGRTTAAIRALGGACRAARRGWHAGVLSWDARPIESACPRRQDDRRRAALLRVPAGDRRAVEIK